MAHTNPGSRVENPHLLEYMNSSCYVGKIALPGEAKRRILVLAE
jgi:hypothetical protein